MNDTIAVCLTRARHAKLLDLVRAVADERHAYLEGLGPVTIPTVRALDAAEILADLERAGRPPLSAA